ncbi:MAG: polymer-forming cytoskeletal protein [Gammaproteobacteria bacterium]|nr:polymer-forming cytoskeletal protein [Gammaproteobacteria bacterium]NIR85526.1 polymer-forming cytoskeletal protein [Gammaproteobacteria bacterium]NIR89785.1 polymer-forming cytoskeletal protein [Gammaproteobacteria bacterium]NIU06661.1 polymer-forming cytoskeletal protein [Gammaproteobacteria bacterium]NIV75052.1 polymer-forming cytoskeletal protein [Gammaproteobacteria bacterium]
MWKKSESEESAAEPTPRPARPTPPPGGSREPAMIGTSISIRGDVAGEEDLIVQGRVEGTIKLPQNSVTVGKDGQIKANIHAKAIEVEGRMEGDLQADEQVVVRRSARVEGNISAPRVALEDGCKFRGSVEMDMGPAAEERPKERRQVSDLKSAPGPSAGTGAQDTPAQPTVAKHTSS